LFFYLLKGIFLPIIGAFIGTAVLFSLSNQFLLFNSFSYINKKKRERNRVATHPGKPGKSGEKILALESQGIFR